MKVFLSAMEHGGQARAIKKFLQDGNKLYWSLLSFYYIGDIGLAKAVIDASQQVLIDSGAHSFQKGKKVDWERFTRDYAAFIKEYDQPKIIGYFEMDVDNILGYERVLELRKILESVSDKIIPVWHKNRGIDDFKKMCQDYAGKVIAVTGFKNEDIKDEQYLMFLKYAKKYGCKMHCLGMTRPNVLDKVPFDFVDSSSWVQDTIYGRVRNVGKVSKEYSKNNHVKVFEMNLVQAKKMQEHYYKKWRKVCGD